MSDDDLKDPFIDDTEDVAVDDEATDPSSIVDEKEEDDGSLMWDEDDEK